MNLGWTEILLVAGIALLLFGPSKLPGLGRSLGESIRGFKKAMTEDSPDEREVRDQLTRNSEKPLNDEASKMTDEQKEAQKDPRRQS